MVDGSGSHIKLRVFAFLGGWIFSTVVGAHHAAFVHFDRDDVVEITGELVSIEWRNPHSLLIVETIGEDGSETLWQGQERGVTLLTRKGATPDLFRVGEMIRVAGFRGRRNKTSLFVTNIMLPDGREVYN